MYKRIFLHAFVAAVLAAIAGLIYCRIYFFATQVDYSRIINRYTIWAGSFLVCMLFSFLFFALVKWKGNTGEIIFNLVFSIGSFAAIMLPLTVNLPLEVKYPELFPGLAIPMVFFPALAWMTIRPYFVHPV